MTIPLLWRIRETLRRVVSVVNGKLLVVMALVLATTVSMWMTNRYRDSQGHRRDAAIEAIADLQAELAEGRIAALRELAEAHKIIIGQNREILDNQRTILSRLSGGQR